MCVLGLLLVSMEGVCILAGCEPREAIFVDVEAQGVDAGDRDVDSEVELEAVEEQGIVDVLTHYVRGAFLGNLTQLVSYNYSLALGGCSWLSYPQLVFVPFHLSLEIHKFIRQQERFRYEIEVLLAMDLSHTRHLLVHQVLPRNVE